MFRRFNCCVFNHPCPIWCPFVNLSCTNDVINPILQNDFGFFNNLAVGAISTQSIIPVGLVVNRGPSITQSNTTAGAVNLLAGTYEISYLANGTVPAGGSMSIKLRLNGFDVSGSTLTTTQTAGNVASLTQTMILTVPQTSTLALVNNSANTTTYSYASMSIKRL